MPYWLAERYKICLWLKNPVIPTEKSERGWLSTPFFLSEVFYSAKSRGSPIFLFIAIHIANLEIGVKRKGETKKQKASRHEDKRPASL